MPETLADALEPKDLTIKTSYKSIYSDGDIPTYDENKELNSTVFGGFSYPCLTSLKRKFNYFFDLKFIPVNSKDEIQIDVNLKKIDLSFYPSEGILFAEESIDYTYMVDLNVSITINYKGETFTKDIGFLSTDNSMTKKGDDSSIASGISKAIDKAYVKCIRKVNDLIDNTIINI
ncbi:hypothetical protein [Ichthyobacterium seriolicida]|nr:hypothetical protein [Ichthyobacterium seriolicida]